MCSEMVFKVTMIVRYSTVSMRFKGYDLLRIAIDSNSFTERDLLITIGCQLCICDIISRPPHLEDFTQRVDSWTT
jgi:hypothetical protein